MNFEDFKDTQKEAYNILTNAVQNNKLGHAYIFETKNVQNKTAFAEAFAHYLLKDNGVLDLKIIKPDGIWIKKEQLKELQNSFKTKSLGNTYRIYIICESEKMNDSASNSILKFIEEPEEGIIAILLTDNTYQLFPTVVSRCQTIRLKYETKTEENSEFKNKIIEFIEFYEKNKINTLLYLESKWFNTVDTNEQRLEAMDIMIDYYKEKIIENHSVDKIKILLKAKDSIKLNANAKLLMDKLICDLEGVGKND